jgi:hypothetical protein
MANVEPDQRTVGDEALIRNERRETQLMEIVDYVAGLGCCEESSNNCGCVTCLAVAIKEELRAPCGFLYFRGSER